jgi:hypothetical protein
MGFVQARYVKSRHRATSCLPFSCSCFNKLVQLDVVRLAIYIFNPPTPSNIYTQPLRPKQGYGLDTQCQG